MLPGTVCTVEVHVMYLVCMYDRWYFLKYNQYRFNQIIIIILKSLILVHMYILIQ